MPDNYGKLSDSDKDKAITWLNSKTNIHTCPSCGHNNWSLGDHLLNLMTYTGPNLIIGGPSYPVVFLMCNNCCFIRQYMAMPMGLPSYQPNADDAKSGESNSKVEGGE